MKPFLFLATRPEDRAADDEYEALLRFSHLDECGVRRVRLEQNPLGTVDLDRWSGVILGGGPFTASDRHRSATQVRLESELGALFDEIVARDFPFLGACYGVGTLGMHQGAVVDRTYGEPVGTTMVTLTQAGRSDPLLGGLPSEFEAFVGHKEAVRSLPRHAVHLASSVACPVQCFRIRNNIYATQFHPELDIPGLITRIEVYKDAGYFPAREADELKALAAASGVEHPTKILQGFVDRFATN